MSIMILEIAVKDDSDKGCKGSRFLKFWCHNMMS